MSDLIKALQIFLKYADPKFPTHCEHDVMWVVGINPADVSEEDIKELDTLGFHAFAECFESNRFGSC
jgi:carbonic anhydrase